MDEYQEKSPAFRFVNELWENKMGATSWSWQRVNSALQSALETAIRGGLLFFESDFETVFDQMRGNYWFGLSDSSRNYGEHFYGIAIDVGNASAWKSFEAWKDRRPFILDGHRLYIGSRFNWEGQQVKVTSFAEDQSYVVACAFETEPDEQGRYAGKKVKRIYKISHADIYARNKAIREAQQEVGNE